MHDVEKNDAVMALVSARRAHERDFPRHGWHPVFDAIQRCSRTTTVI
jgi:hypothetical protein